MPTIAKALKRLQDGNQRFAARQRKIRDRLPADLAYGQAPFAVILGCSDSRVPAEIVFDQGLGDLFVIRVAGNIVAPTQIGSVEFAATQLGAPLVVVLGHGKCGAIAATLDEMNQPVGAGSRNLRSIVERIEPSIKPLMERGPWDNPAKLMDAAVRANVRASVQHLKSGSRILEELIEQRKLAIVGAEYELESGVVDFFEVPAELR
ncbi:MAG: carbonic anhydrase [Oceanococcus sp.]